MRLDTEPVSQLRSVATNGGTVIFGVLIAALVGVTVLAALHDINSDAVVAIYSAIIGGGIGHLTGSAHGKTLAENAQLKANASTGSRRSKR